jgi:phage terminase Nu1 subunit (DNA packaging protein)
MIADKPTVAKIFDTSPDTVRRWQQAGMPHYPPANPSGTADQRRVKYDTRAVHEWLVQRALMTRW